MASQEIVASAPSDEGNKEKFTYSASSFRIKTNEEELFELVQLSEVPIDKELFKVILEMLKLNIAPVAILQVLKSLKSQATSHTPTDSAKPSRDSSKHRLSKSHTSKSAKKTSKETLSQDQRRPSSKHSSKSSKKRTTAATSSSDSLHKEKTSSKT